MDGSTAGELPGVAELHSPRSQARLWPIYVGALVFFILRTPWPVLHGLIMGEEGTVYLRYAWDTPWLRALFAPHQGYYSLFPNVIGILAARVFPLEAAGYLCVYAELGVQLLLVHIIVECERFPGLYQKALAAAVALLSPPTIAIVLCTDNAQFFLAVASVVILISDAERRSVERASVLALAGLNGVLSCTLLPLFMLSAWLERSRARWVQVSVLAACTVVQACTVYSQPRPSSHSSLAFLAGALLTQGPIGQFASRWSAAEVCKATGSPKIAPIAPLFWFAIEMTAVAYLSAIVSVSARMGRAVRTVSLAATLSVALALTHAGALNYDLMCGAGAHYFFVFDLLVALEFVLLSFAARSPLRGLARLLVVCALLSGSVDLTYAMRLRGPAAWQDEVRLWRADPAHRLRIGPGDWPGIRLTRRHANRDLPANIYDSTQPGWEDR